MIPVKFHFLTPEFRDEFDRMSDYLWSYVGQKHVNPSSDALIRVVANGVTYPFRCSKDNPRHEISRSPIKLARSVAKLARRFGGSVSDMCEWVKRKFHGIDHSWSIPDDQSWAQYWTSRSTLCRFIVHLQPDKPIQTILAGSFESTWEINFDTMTIVGNKVEWTMRDLYRVKDSELWYRSCTGQAPDYKVRIALARIKHWIRHMRAYREAHLPPHGFFFQLAMRRFYSNAGVSLLTHTAHDDDDEIGAPVPESAAKDQAQVLGAGGRVDC